MQWVLPKYTLKETVYNHKENNCFESVYYFEVIGTSLGSILDISALITCIYLSEQ